MKKILFSLIALSLIFSNVDAQVSMRSLQRVNFDSLHVKVGRIDTLESPADTIFVNDVMKFLIPPVLGSTQQDTISSSADTVFINDNLKVINGLIIDTLYAHANDTIYVGDNIKLLSTLNIDGVVIMLSTLDVTGATTLLSTLDVTGAVTINGIDVIDSTKILISDSLELALLKSQFADSMAAVDSSYITDGKLGINDLNNLEILLNSRTDTIKTIALISDSLFALDLLADSIKLDTLGFATFNNVQQMQNVFHSAGWVDGGQITAFNSADTSVNVAVGSGYIRGIDSTLVTLSAFDWPAATNISVADSTWVFVFVDENSGNPQITTSATNPTVTEFQTNVLLGAVFKESDAGIHINTAVKHLVGDHAGQMIFRLKATTGMTRESGAIVTEAGTRGIAVSSSTWWTGLSDFSLPAFTTAGTDSFEVFYRNGRGGWVVQTRQTQLSNTEYDDNSGTLATVSNNRFGNFWIYIIGDQAGTTTKEISIVLGQGNYTLEQAQDAGEPSSLPPVLATANVTKLIAKVIIKKSEANFEEIRSQFDPSISAVASTVFELNDLSDVTLTAEQTADVMAFNGTIFVNDSTFLKEGSQHIATTTTDTAFNIVANTLTTGVGLKVGVNNTNFNSGRGLVYFQLDTSDTSPELLWLENNGTGDGIFIDQNGNGIGLRIDSEATNQPAFQAVFNGLYIGVATSAASFIHLDDAGSTGTGQYILHDGSGVGLHIVGTNATNNSSFVDIDYAGDTGLALDVATTNATGSVARFIANNKTTGWGVSISTGSSGFTGSGVFGLLDILVTNGSATGNAVRIQQVGTGDGIFIDQNGNGVALNIDSEATTAGIIIIDAPTSGKLIDLKHSGTTIFSVDGSDSTANIEFDLNHRGQILPNTIVSFGDYLATPDYGLGTDDDNDTTNVFAKYDSLTGGLYPTLVFSDPDTSSEIQFLDVFSPVYEVPFQFAGLDSIVLEFYTEIDDVDTTSIKFDVYEYNEVSGAITFQDSTTQLTTEAAWTHNATLSTFANISRYSKFIIKIEGRTLYILAEIRVGRMIFYWKEG